jgi:hypothetical protein
VVEEGLPGRTAQFPDPVMGAHMDGRDGIKIALQSHGPIDALTIMLGTNDVKTRYGASPEKIAGGIAGLLDIAMGDEMQTRHGGFRVLVICPPPVLEQGPIVSEFTGSRELSLRLPPLYEALARRGGRVPRCGRVIEVSPVDGIHFEPEAHVALGPRGGGGGEGALMRARGASVCFRGQGGAFRAFEVARDSLRLR